MHARDDNGHPDWLLRLLNLLIKKNSLRTFRASLSAGEIMLCDPGFRAASRAHSMFWTSYRVSKSLRQHESYDKPDHDVADQVEPIHDDR